MIKNIFEKKNTKINKENTEKNNKKNLLFWIKKYG